MGKKVSLFKAGSQDSGFEHEIVTIKSKMQQLCISCPLGSIAGNTLGKEAYRPPPPTINQPRKFFRFPPIFCRSNKNVS